MPNAKQIEHLEHFYRCRLSTQYLEESSMQVGLPHGGSGFVLPHKITLTIEEASKAVTTTTTTCNNITMGKKAKSNAGKKKAQDRKIDKSTLPPPPPRPEDEVCRYVSS